MCRMSLHGRLVALASALAVEKIEPAVRLSAAVIRNARTGQRLVEECHAGSGISSRRTYGSLHRSFEQSPPVSQVLVATLRDFRLVQRGDSAQRGPTHRSPISDNCAQQRVPYLTEHRIFQDDPVIRERPHSPVRCPPSR
jgi:hypothetical protein